MVKKNQSVFNTQVLVEEQVQPSSRKQIGLLGGTFNPIHLAHLVMADQVKHSLGLDRVDILPSFLPPHIDEKKTIAANHRLRMIQLAIADNPHLGIETIELQRQGKSYTFDTMKQLTEAHPDTDYYFIIGGDMVEYLPKWYKVDELMELVQFVGIRRPEFSTETNYPIIWVDIPEIGISSTEIRKKIKQGCSVRYFLPDSVIDYIQAEELYLDEE